MKRLVSWIAVLSAVLMMTSCAEEKPLSRTVTALDTVCTISLYDGKEEIALDASVHLLREGEERWSRTKAGSMISKLNAANGAQTTVDTLTYQLLQTAQEYSLATDGAFDVTLGALTDLWTAAEERGSVPTNEELTAALFASGSYKMILGDGTVTLMEGVRLDLGGIAKGAIADDVAQGLRLGGCTSALLDFGGNIVAIGSKPDGSPFHVGIADPKNPDNLVGTIAVHDRAVVTSGSYERGYMIDDVWYSHILNPKTGYPVENDLLSVTILAPNALDADVLSTACFVMGFDRAQAFLQSYEDVDAVFVKADGTVVATDGVKRVD